MRTIMVLNAKGGCGKSTISTNLASYYAWEREEKVVLADFDPRDRPIGETPKLVYEGLLKGGFQEQNIEIVTDPDKAVDYLF